MGKKNKIQNNITQLPFPEEDWNGNWVLCNSSTESLSTGKKYKVRGHHKYNNKYGTKGDYFYSWDEFLTLKNDYGYTIKVRKSRFTLTERPLTLAELEEKVKLLELKLNK